MIQAIRKKKKWQNDLISLQGCGFDAVAPDLVTAVDDDIRDGFKRKKN